MRNQKVVEKLRQIGQLYAVENDEYRSTAYFRAAAIIERLRTPLASTDLLKIKGIGKSTEQVVRDLERIGTCSRLEELLKKYPHDAKRLQKIPGVNLKTAYELSAKYKIASVNGLVEVLERSGADNDLLSRAKLSIRSSVQERISRKAIEKQAEKLVVDLKSEPAIDKCVIAGSYRRKTKTIKDLDILVQLRKGFKPPILQIIAKKHGTIKAAGSRKVTIQRKRSPVINIDFMIVSPVSWGAALCHFTGSKEHNIRLRSLARSKGLKVNEYGIYKGAKRIGGTHEEDLYTLLNLDYVLPENRTE